MYYRGLKVDWMELRGIKFARSLGVIASVPASSLKLNSRLCRLLFFSFTLSLHVTTCSGLRGTTP